MKLAVLTDAHGNLPALEAALGAIRAEGCDAIYHTGDAIGIGPYPAETLDCLLNTPSLYFVMAITTPGLRTGYLTRACRT